MCCNVQCDVRQARQTLEWTLAWSPIWKLCSAHERGLARSQTEKSAAASHSHSTSGDS